MKLSKSLLPALLALCLFGAAHAAEDASHYLLTPAVMQKFKALDAEAGKLKLNGKDEDDQDDGDRDDSIEGIIRKIESDPRTKAALARHGISPREYAHAAYAMLQAGMYVGMESQMDKKGREKLYASYTREQKANIALMRNYVPAQKK